MDLGTVLQKIVEEKYEHVEEFLDDTELIWDNCKSYNIKGSVKRLIFSGYINSPTNLRRIARKCWRITSPPSLSWMLVTHFTHRKRCPKWPVQHRPTHSIGSSLSWADCCHSIATEDHQVQEVIEARKTGKGGKTRSTILLRRGVNHLCWENEASWQIQGALPCPKRRDSEVHSSHLSTCLPLARWKGATACRQHGHHHFQTNYWVLMDSWRKIEEIEVNGQIYSSKRVKYDWLLLLRLVYWEHCWFIDSYYADCSRHHHDVFFTLLALKDDTINAVPCIINLTRIRNSQIIRINCPLSLSIPHLNYYLKANTTYPQVDSAFLPFSTSQPSISMKLAHKLQSLSCLSWKNGW